MLGWGSGSLLDHAIDQARVLSTSVWVVSGCYYPVSRYRVTRRPSRWVYNPDWHLGMASSLRAGLGALPASCPGVFVVLVDQPLVSTESLVQLRKSAEHQRHQAIAADHQGRPGAPAYLPRRLWPAIGTLEGDRGAGQILRQVGAQTLIMPGAETDADTPADWRHLQQVLSEQTR